MSTNSLLPFLKKISFFDRSIFIIPYMGYRHGLQSPPKIWHESSSDLGDIKIDFVSVNSLRLFLIPKTNLDHFDYEMLCVNVSILRNIKSNITKIKYYLWYNEIQVFIQTEEKFNVQMNLNEEITLYASILLSFEFLVFNLQYYHLTNLLIQRIQRKTMFF